jgi:hypothetical protein
MLALKSFLRTSTSTVYRGKLVRTFSASKSEESLSKGGNEVILNQPPLILSDKYGLKGRVSAAVVQDKENRSSASKQVVEITLSPPKV